MKYYLPFLLFLLSVSAHAQEENVKADSLIKKPIIDLKEEGFLKKIDGYFYSRLGFLNHSEHGRDDDFSEFRNSYVAMGIRGQIHENVGFNYRQRFNKSSERQSLDLLDNSIELANVDLKVAPQTHLQFGKMSAYFGGYEYEFNPIDVLEYNEVSSNLLAYVSGIGITHQIAKNHLLGFQALNSRTMRYADLYEGKVEENVQEPKWPLALVLKWQGDFYDKKFQTIYSVSRYRIAKGHATTYAITLGNKFQTEKWTLMYDFNYSHEQLDTKGIVTSILNTDKIAQDATYIENWLRAEYMISSKFQALLTLMNSNSYAENAKRENSGFDHLKTSYGVIPTLYYRPFKDIDVRFYASYIGRYYTFSNFVKEDLDITNYNTNEFQVGLMAPLWVF